MNSENVITRTMEVRGGLIVCEGVLLPAQCRVGSGAVCFSVFDTVGLSLATRAGLPVALVAATGSQELEHAARNAGVELIVAQGRETIAASAAFCTAHGLTPEQLFTIGADVPDLPLLQLSCLPLVPQDAMADAKSAAIHILSRCSGSGAAREALEMILRNQGRWGAAVRDFCE